MQRGKKLSFNVDLSKLLLEDARLIPSLENVDDTILRVARFESLGAYHLSLSVISVRHAHRRRFAQIQPAA